MIELVQVSLDAGLQKIAALRAPDYVDARVLAQTTAEVHTVPAGAQFVLFSSTGDFYARYGAAAAIPAADVTDGTSPELNPQMRDISGVATIGLIAPAACVVTLSFYG